MGKNGAMKGARFRNLAGQLVLFISALVSPSVKWAQEQYQSLRDALGSDWETVCHVLLQWYQWPMTICCGSGVSCALWGI